VGRQGSGAGWRGDDVFRGGGGRGRHLIVQEVLISVVLPKVHGAVAGTEPDPPACSTRRGKEGRRRGGHRSRGGAGVGISYIVTKFATMSESLLVYYTITVKSASARIQL
jgi:hypothetical protein